MSFAGELKNDSTCESAPEFYVRNQYHLTSWLDVSAFLEGRALDLEADYGHVEGGRRTPETRTQARVELYEPKPVTIDAGGHVYERTGERAIVPGLDPGRVAREMGDARAGRTRSLKDIIAARTGTGI